MPVMATGGGLRFDPVERYPPGILFDLLRRSYDALVTSDPAHWLAEVARWQAFDRDVFAHLDSIGACVFLSCADWSDGGGAIGFGSYRPRADGSGEVGHHCIVPECRGQGYGARQLAEIVRRLRARGATSVFVTTSEHPFFAPARRLYINAGFVEIGRRAGGPDPRYGLIDYRLLAGHAGEPHA